MLLIYCMLIKFYSCIEKIIELHKENNTLKHCSAVVIHLLVYKVFVLQFMLWKKGEITAICLKVFF